MAKIWQKDYDLNQLIEAFTVGVDYQLDRELVASDCVASMAQAKQLKSIGILSAGECDGLIAALTDLLQLHEKGQFPITQADEDCHTAIENFLIERVGEAGKKIHTGRSRNDQVLTALRLFSKAYLFSLLNEGIELASAFLHLARREEMTPMPGRTHLQPAMPSSVGLWAGSFAEALLDELSLCFRLLSLVDQSPLGAAASYGVPLPLNRELTAKLMGFSKVQRNVLYVNNSRGLFESMILDAADAVVLTLSKAAQDLILFSLPEFGYFSLPRSLCSGSSIMPQKKNPDALELMRAKSATLSAYATAVKNVIRSLPTGYNRDFQETKEPFLRGCRLSVQCVQIMTLTVNELQVNRDRLTAAFTPEIYATDQALEWVQQGMSFRDAYRKVGLSLETVELQSAAEALKKRTSTGAPGNLQLPALQSELEAFSAAVSEPKNRFDAAIEQLAGRPCRLF